MKTRKIISYKNKYGKYKVIQKPFKNVNHFDNYLKCLQRHDNKIIGITDAEEKTTENDNNLYTINFK